jgi:O-antigen ligase
MRKGNIVAFRIAGRVDLRARAGGGGAQRRPPGEGIRQSKVAAGAGGTGKRGKFELPPSLADISVIGLFVGIFLLSVPVPPQVPVGITAGAAGLLLLVKEPKDRTLGGRARALYVFGIGFLVATVFSVLASDAVLRSVRVSLLLLPLLLVFQAIGSRFDRERVDQLAGVLVVASGAVSLQFLITALTHLDQSPTQWVAATGLPYFSVPNDLLFVVIAAPLALTLLFSPTPKITKLLAAASLVLAFAAVTLYQSRTGLALLVLACAGFAVTGSRAAFRATLWLLPLGVALILLVDTVANFGMLAKFSQFQTLSLRIPLWTAAWKMFLASPWLGHGPGLFSLSYEDYLRGVHFPEWVLVAPWLHSPWAHSLYLELLAERGLGSLVAFLGVIMVAGRMLWSQVCQAGDHSLSLALGLCLALILIGGLTELSLLRYWFSQLLFVLLAMVFALNEGGDMNDE